MQRIFQAAAWLLQTVAGFSRRAEHAKAIAKIRGWLDAH
jgi:hypothetical protein